MTFRKEFLPPPDITKDWEREYWQIGKECGRFPCSFNEYLLMKSAEWGALKIRRPPRTRKRATGVSSERADAGPYEQSTIFDLLAPSA